VDELIRRWQTDGPGKVGEDHRRLELQDDDGVPLDGRLDHPDDPTLLLPRGAAVEPNGGEPGHPLRTALPGTTLGFNTAVIL